MRLLIYGFGPYLAFEDNITQKAIALLPEMPDVATHVFDVDFDREMFETGFATYQPQMILGLGQHGRAAELRIELLARNVMNNPGEEPSKINPEGEALISTSLQLPSIAGAIASDDAGSYVCNYSMYVGMEYARKTGAKYGFLHIPRTENPSMIARLLVRLANELGGDLPIV